MDLGVDLGMELEGHTVEKEEAAALVQEDISLSIPSFPQNPPKLFGRLSNVDNLGLSHQLFACEQVVHLIL